MRVFVIVAIFMLSFSSHAIASNVGFGVHGGVGVMKYEEHTSTYNSEAKLPMFIVGASAEYSFNWPQNFYAGITTDWAWGLEDDEEIKQVVNGSHQKEIVDLNIFSQFYDGRLGYKDVYDDFEYRLYISGGWDGVHFERSATEDFSLWRIGGGLNISYNLGSVAVDVRGAYSYYFDGDVRSSAYGGQWFDTNGTCLDAGLGFSKNISEKIGLYIGGSYTSIKLDESEVKQLSPSQTVQFPEGELQMFAGVVNLTFSF